MSKAPYYVEKETHPLTVRARREQDAFLRESLTRHKDVIAEELAKRQKVKKRSDRTRPFDQRIHTG